MQFVQTRAAKCTGNRSKLPRNGRVASIDLYNISHICIFITPLLLPDATLCASHRYVQIYISTMLQHRNLYKGLRGHSRQVKSRFYTIYIRIIFFTKKCYRSILKQSMLHLSVRITYLDFFCVIIKNVDTLLKYLC